MVQFTVQGLEFRATRAEERDTAAATYRYESPLGLDPCHTKQRADLKQDVCYTLLFFSLSVTHGLLQFVTEFVFELQRRETSAETTW